MPRRPGFGLARIVASLGKLCPPRHRDLVRGMVAELDSIDDPAERTRFALGATAAIARMALSGYSRAPLEEPGRFVLAREPEDGAESGGSPMSKLTSRQLLRRHATAFGVSCAALTVLLLANEASRLLPRMGARGVPVGTIAEVLLLALPMTMALTIPMAVFLAVSWVFAGLGADGVLAAARRERHGVRRLLVPVLAAAAVIAALTFVSNTLVLPRANARIAAVVEGGPQRLTDRTMTVGELREAARAARAQPGTTAAYRAVAYEVEIQKKFALAAACLVLAMAGAAIAMRFPRGGLGLVFGASSLVFTGYYLSLVAGEVLADRRVISPLIAMWLANASVLAVALLLAWRPGRREPTRGAETLAIGR